MACTETSTYVVTEISDTYINDMGSQRYSMFDIIYAEAGVEKTKQGVYLSSWPNYGIESETSGDGSDRNDLRWYGVPTGINEGSTPSNSEYVRADRGGICVEESTTESESEESTNTVASDLGTSTMYFASLADDIEFDADTGLMKTDKFGLKWNNFEGKADWDDDTKGQYSSIEGGEVSGTITIVKENVYDNTTTAAYNTFYDLNTGASQVSPTITLIAGSGKKEFTVTYGTVELEAIEAKYKRYQETFTNSVDRQIDQMVQVAIDGSYQARAGLNFKKTKVKTFKNKNVTIFSGEMMEGSTEETTGEQTMGTDVTAGTSGTTTTTTTMTTSNGGSAQGGY